MKSDVASPHVCQLSVQHKLSVDLLGRLGIVIELSPVAATILIILYVYFSLDALVRWVTPS
jgi:hypothetical protein